MRITVACVLALLACGTSEPGSSAPALPPGIGGPITLPPPARGKRVMASGRFRHSSIRGDFRIYKTSAGIVVSWNTLLSARSLDGTPLWKREGQGRAVAVSPDGTRIVTNNDAGELLVLDATTGAPIGPATQLGGSRDRTRRDVWVTGFAWMPDGTQILALDYARVYVLHADGSLDRELAVGCKARCFFMSAVGLANGEAIIANSAGTDGQILRVNLADGSIVRALDLDGSDPDLSADGKRVLIDAAGNVAMLDSATLKPIWTVGVPGFHGVAKTATSMSSEEWKSMPKLSPDGAYVAINDRAGRLWLLDAKNGHPVLAYPTELIDFVEDVMWLDNGTLIAIDNAGHVIRLAGTPARVVWSQMDGPERVRWDTL